MNTAKIKYVYNSSTERLEVFYGRIVMFTIHFASRKTAMGSVIKSKEHYQQLVHNRIMEMAEGDAKVYAEIVAM